MLKKIQINVDDKIYADFKALCQEENIPAAIKIRELMKKYVADNSTSSASS